MNNMEDFRHCLAAVKDAETDTEKLAILLTIPDRLRASYVSSQMKEILDCLDSNFFHRLLHSEEIKSSSGFRPVVLAMLADLCRDPELSLHNVICSEVPIFKEIITSVPTSPQEESTIDDALQCLLSTVSHNRGRQVLIENGISDALLRIFMQKSYAHEKAFHLLMMIICQSGNEIWDSNPEAFTDLIKKLAADFASDNSIHKFELCDIIMRIIMKYHTHSLQPDEEWCIHIREGLNDILRSKVTKYQRDSALKLVSIMVEKFGAHWLLEESESSIEFFGAVVQLVCVEVRMILEEKSVDEIMKDVILLTACYSILECSISVLVDDTIWHWESKYTEPLLASIKLAFSYILGFMSVLSSKWEVLSLTNSNDAAIVREITFATVRVLCSWMAEETFALRQEVGKVLPFLLRVAKDSVSGSQCPEKQKIGQPMPNICYIDMMRFFVAPLCHLTADDSMRKILLAEKLHTFLFEYLEHQWAVYQKAKAMDLEVLLTTICGIFLNIVVLEGKLVNESETFFNLLKFLLNVLPQLNINAKQLPLTANFAVLGLLISKQCHKRIKSCETSFYRFLSASVKFLWDAHHVEDTNNTNSFVIVREYRKIWTDIMELWYLGMQALTSLLTLLPWICNFLLESGWPQHIIVTLNRVGESEIEGSVKSAYQAFLCGVVRSYPDAVLALIDCGASAVCSTHKLKELQSLLPR